jgi:hypothetical protein
MILLTQSIIQIVAAGGGFVFDLDKQMFTVQTMIQIAAAAAHSGAKVTFKTGKYMLTTQTMIQIAAAGRGNVVFDLS